MRFRAADEDGEMYEQDLDFARHIYPEGAEQVLREVGELTPEDPVDSAVLRAVLAADEVVSARLEADESILDLEGAGFGSFRS